MTVTVNTDFVCQAGEDTPDIARVTQTGGGLNRIREHIASSQTNVQFNFAVDVSTITYFRMKASAACTIKTNSTGSPDQTLSLAAGRVYVWNSGDLSAFFLTQDVTTIYVTTSTTAVDLEIDSLGDVTP